MEESGIGHLKIEEESVVDGSESRKKQTCVSKRMPESFVKWFASYLGQEDMQVTKLLRDKTATMFLIAWSIFESDCFSGSMEHKKIEDFAKRMAVNPNLNRLKLVDALKHFHNRYQEPKHYKNLMHQQKTEKLEKILAKNVSELSIEEQVFLLVVVVYRFRNNIFHGNKGVDSWLAFKTEIEHCITIMQELINIAEPAH